MRPKRKNKINILSLNHQQHIAYVYVNLRISEAIQKGIVWESEIYTIEKVLVCLTNLDGNEVYCLYG